MKLFVASILLFIIPSLALSQSAEILSMGETAFARKDINALFGNQAGLTHLKSASISVNTERRFNLGELANHTVGFAIPSAAGTFGFVINYFGFDEFNEQKIGLAYARKLGKRFSFGAQFDYIGTRINEFGNANTYTVELGILAAIGQQIDLGAHFFNPISVDSGVDDEPLENVLSFGLNYRPSKHLSLMADVEAELDFTPRYKIGIDYSFSDIFNLRIGAHTEPTSLSLGIGLKLDDNFKIDLATEYQTILGISPGIGLRYDFPIKK